MKRPVIALLLNALLLPGAGQVYLGRKVKGIALIMAVNLLLLGALFLVLKVMGPLLAAQMAGSAVTVPMVVAQAQPYALWAKLLLAAFLGLWGYGLLDLLSAFRKSGDQ